MTEIAVKNFKTLRDVRIPLARGITVLVGANNSGKSNALAVLKLLAEAERQHSFSTAVEAFGGWESVRTRGVAYGLDISLHLEHDGGQFVLLVEESPDSSRHRWGWYRLGSSQRLSGDARTPLIEEQDGRVYGAEDVSDGLLLFIGLAVAAQLKADKPGLLAIEEPERGIHPRRIREVLDHLRRLTRNGTQVVLTTHSPTLLDEFRDTPEKQPDRDTMRRAALPIAETLDVDVLAQRSTSFDSFLRQLR
jgi:predicted ATPase